MKSILALAVALGMALGSNALSSVEVDHRLAMLRRAAAADFDTANAAYVVPHLFRRGLSRSNSFSGFPSSHYETPSAPSPPRSPEPGTRPPPASANRPPNSQTVAEAKQLPKGRQDPRDGAREIGYTDNMEHADHIKEAKDLGLNNPSAPHAVRPKGDKGRATAMSSDEGKAAEKNKKPDEAAAGMKLDKDEKGGMSHQKQNPGESTTVRNLSHDESAGVERGQSNAAAREARKDKTQGTGPGTTKSVIHGMSSGDKRSYPDARPHDSPPPSPGPAAPPVHETSKREKFSNNIAPAGSPAPGPGHLQRSNSLPNMPLSSPSSGGGSGGTKRPEPPSRGPSAQSPPRKRPGKRDLEAVQAALYRRALVERLVRRGLAEKEGRMFW